MAMKRYKPLQMMQMMRTTSILLLALSTATCVICVHGQDAATTTTTSAEATTATTTTAATVEEAPEEPANPVNPYTPQCQCSPTSYQFQLQLQNICPPPDTPIADLMDANIINVEQPGINRTLCFIEVVPDEIEEVLDVDEIASGAIGEVEEDMEDTEDVGEEESEEGEEEEEEGGSLGEAIGNVQDTVEGVEDAVEGAEDAVEDVVEGVVDGVLGEEELGLELGSDEDEEGDEGSVEDEDSGRKLRGSIANRIYQSRKRILKRVDTSRHVRHATESAIHLLQRRRVQDEEESQEAEEAEEEVNTVPIYLTSILFLEVDYSPALQILNQDSTYFDANLPSQSLLNFTSISSTLNTTKELSDQVELAPGGVLLAMFGVNEDGVLIASTVTWGYDLVNCEVEPVGVGDNLGWIQINDYTPAKPEFCPVIQGSKSGKASSKSGKLMQKAPSSKSGKSVKATKSKEGSLKLKESKTSKFEKDSKAEKEVIEDMGADSKAEKESVSKGGKAGKVMKEAKAGKGEDDMSEMSLSKSAKTKQAEDEP